MIHHYRNTCRVFICILIASSAINAAAPTNPITSNTHVTVKSRMENNERSQDPVFGVQGGLENPRSPIIRSMLSEAALLTSMSQGSVNQSPESSIHRDFSMDILNGGSSELNKSAETLVSGNVRAINFSLLGVESLPPVDLSQIRDGQTSQPLSSSFSGDRGWLDSLLAGKPLDSSLVGSSRSFMTMDPLLDGLGSFPRMDSPLAGDSGSFPAMDLPFFEDPGSFPDINTSSAGDAGSLSRMVSSRNMSDVTFLPIESSVRGKEPNQFMDVLFIGGNRDSLTHSPTNDKSLNLSSVGGQTDVQGVERSSDLPPWFSPVLTLGPANPQNPEPIGILESTSSHTSHDSHAEPPISDGKPEAIKPHVPRPIQVPKTTIGVPALKEFGKLPLIGNIHETVWKINKDSNAQLAITHGNEADVRIKGSSLPVTGARGPSWSVPLVGAVIIPEDPVIVDNPQLRGDVSTVTAGIIRSESALSNTGLKPVSMSELLSLLNSKSDQIGNAGISFFNLGTTTNDKTHQEK